MKVKKIQSSWIIQKHETNRVTSYELDLSKTIQIDDVMLVLRKKKQQYERYHLKEKIVIGRDFSCDIVFMHQMISKQHASIFFASEWFIEDLQSKNGVYVNGKKMTKQKLSIGDVITIEGFDFYFNPLFIYIPIPDLCQLPIFHPTYLLKESQQQPQLCLLKVVDEPPKQTSYSTVSNTSWITDLIYLYFYLENPSMKMMLYIIAVRLLVHLVRLCHFILEKIQQKYMQRGYQRYLCDRFKPIAQLEKVYYIQSFDHYQVRIGSKKKQPVMYDFGMYPKLIIVGEQTKAISLITSIIYQIERYYKDVSIHTTTLYEPWIMSKSRKKEASKTLSLFSDEGDFCILHYPDTQQLPICDAMIHVDEGWYYTTRKEKLTLEFCEDHYILSRHFKVDSKYEIPLFFERFSVRECRKYQNIQSSFKGILGYQQDRILYLDLHEKTDGPHLLVAGMSGSGKSEWLTSFLLSMAMFYDSDDLEMMVIDFKGGALSSLFEKLNHTSMVLTNLDFYQINRAIAALEDELLRREEMLLKASKDVGVPISDIHQLKHYYSMHQTTINFTHLLVVIDEFAELKLLYPEIMQSLVRIARTGRSLGIHLVLSTQRPGGIVDRQIESNIATKVCLKVASKQDSYDLLGNDHAFLLEKAGMLVCQSGTSQMQASTLFVNMQRPQITFYDLWFHEQFHIALEKELSNRKIDCIHRINNYTAKVKPLFVKDFKNEFVSLDVLGIYDDYKHRRVGCIKKDLRILVIGGFIEEFKDVNNIVQKNRQERIFSKDLDGYEGVLLFDEKLIFQLLSKRIDFEMIPEKGIGAFYMKGELYQCKIRFGVI